MPKMPAIPQLVSAPLNPIVVTQSSIFRLGSDSQSTLREDQQSNEGWIIAEKSRLSHVFKSSDHL